MSELPWYLPLFILAVVAIASAVVALKARRRLKRFSMKRRFERGRAGEEQAETLLRRHGFEIITDQLRETTGLWIDNVWEEVEVRADFLARRRGKTFVVEVKTGRKAPDPTSTATRRQLFEYHHVYDADGLLLADMERAQLMEIRFPDRGVSRIVRSTGVGWTTMAACCLVSLAMGGLLAAALLR